jgi:hypothetical protein
MGPFGRQAVRVILAAKLSGLDSVTHGFIADVLNECGVPCKPSQIGSALGSLLVAHPRGVVVKHSETAPFKTRPWNARHPGWMIGTRTVGWSVGSKALVALEQNPMSKIGWNTSTYRYGGKV